jgi:8-oxo-dGTP pyrophosphatase MutT (NUDIX family)
MRTIQREIVGGFIFSDDGHILLGKSKPGGVYPGFMVVPGGGVDEGETKADAIKREVLEEVGIDIREYPGTNVEMINDSESGESEKVLRDTGEKVMVHMHFNDFAISIPKAASKIPATSDDDFTDAVWIPLAELPKLKLTEPTKATLRKLGHL